MDFENIQTIPGIEYPTEEEFLSKVQEEYPQYYEEISRGLENGMLNAEVVPAVMEGVLSPPLGENPVFIGFVIAVVTIISAAVGYIAYKDHKDRQ